MITSKFLAVGETFLVEELSTQREKKIRVKNHNRTRNTPYQHFQAQDHSENVLHKNVQSNTYLNQAYAPRFTI